MAKTCSRCKGEGKIRCPVCRGKGFVDTLPLGLMHVDCTKCDEGEITCPACNGSGEE